MEKLISFFLASCFIIKLRADTPGTLSHLHFLGHCLSLVYFFGLCANYPKSQGGALCGVVEGEQAGNSTISCYGCARIKAWSLPHGCSRNIHEPQYLLQLPRLFVATAKETREHLAKVFVCVKDYWGDHRSVPPVRNPLHIFLFANTMAGDQDSRAKRVGLGTNIKRWSYQINRIMG